MDKSIIYEIKVYNIALSRNNELQSLQQSASIN
jgi:hypothetical protein